MALVRRRLATDPTPRETSPASLNVVSPDATEFFFGRAGPAAEVHVVGSLPELHDVLVRHRDQVEWPVTLDLLGHSTRGHRLLRLGDTPIDMLNPAVARFFRRLADQGLPPPLQVDAVRLLGCETAVTAAGQRTLRMLSQTLRVPVYGTSRPLLRGHMNAAGFNPVFSHLLEEAAV